MSEQTWTPDELDRLGAADEIRIAARAVDGGLRRPLPIWVVRVGDELYARSWRGEDGSWYRSARASGEAHISARGIARDVTCLAAGDGVNDAVGTGYRKKYGRCPGYVEPMVAPQARATTLRLIPAAA